MLFLKIAFQYFHALYDFCLRKNLKERLAVRVSQIISEPCQFKLLTKQAGGQVALNFYREVIAY